MRTRARIASLFLIAAFVAAETNVAEEAGPPAAIADLLGAPGEGFAVAEGPREFEFPADHGPHPEYRSEWWYFTGNVSDPEGNRYGFQLTFFRFRLAPGSGERRSAWATEQVYMAHFAVTDVEEERFHAFERFSRGALELAGAQAAPFRVWLEDWSASGQGGAGDFTARLRANESGAGIDVAFGPGEGPILHGDGGYSRKSAVPGYASYYYSYPRMPVSGRLWTPRGDYEVSGEGWLDREWSSSALVSNQVGWDWFALRLSDGSALMLYQLRRRDASVDPFSYGVLVHADGGTAPLAPRDFTIEITKHWQSPDTKIIYPSGWRLLIPSMALELEVEPLVVDQEWRQAFRYWEGSVSVGGHTGSFPVSGSGYVELTGYASSSDDP